MFEDEYLKALKKAGIPDCPNRKKGSGGNVITVKKMERERK